MFKIFKLIILILALYATKIQSSDFPVTDNCKKISPALGANYSDQAFAPVYEANENGETKIEVYVHSNGNGHISLSSENIYTPNFYEFVIGGNENKDAYEIRRKTENENDKILAETTRRDTLSLWGILKVKIITKLNDSGSRVFDVYIKDEETPILSAVDESPMDVNFIGFMSFFHESTYYYSCDGKPTGETEGEVEVQTGTELNIQDSSYPEAEDLKNEGDVYTGPVTTIGEVEVQTATELNIQDSSYPEAEDLKNEGDVYTGPVTTIGEVEVQTATELNIQDSSYPEAEDLKEEGDVNTEPVTTIGEVEVQTGTELNIQDDSHPEPEHLKEEVDVYTGPVTTIGEIEVQTEAATNAEDTTVMESVSAYPKSKDLNEEEVNLYTGPVTTIGTQLNPETETLYYYTTEPETIYSTQGYIEMESNPQEQIESSTKFGTETDTLTENYPETATLIDTESNASGTDRTDATTVIPEVDTETAELQATTSIDTESNTSSGTDRTDAITDIPEVNTETAEPRASTSIDTESNTSGTDRTDATTVIPEVRSEIATSINTETKKSVTAEPTVTTNGKQIPDFHSVLLTAIGTNVRPKITHFPIFPHINEFGLTANIPHNAYGKNSIFNIFSPRVNRPNAFPLYNVNPFMVPFHPKPFIFPFTPNVIQRNYIYPYTNYKSLPQPNFFN